MSSWKAYEWHFKFSNETIQTAQERSLSKGETFRFKTLEINCIPLGFCSAKRCAENLSGYAENCIRLTICVVKMFSFQIGVNQLKC